MQVKQKQMVNKTKNTILIVDDEEGIRDQLYWALRDDYAVVQAGSSDEALEKVSETPPDLILLDLCLNEASTADDGFALFEKFHNRGISSKVIIMTGNAEEDAALKAVKMGAFDFYRKPIDLDEMQIIVDRALRLQFIEGQIASSQPELSKTEIIGESPKLLEAFNMIERTATSNATVLITGESGTGKELAAKALHQRSNRRDMPFVVINCGAIPENLLESELFGHEKGAFTGATATKEGKFELANGGTIFLDEIGDLDGALQVKILRALQEREIERVGGKKTIALDVRIVAATNRNLEEEIELGNFRADLFYRLSVITVQLPPLRERGKDIELLSKYFLQKFATEFKRRVLDFSAASKEQMMKYAWPGNIRELENRVKRAVLLSRGAIILPEDLNLQSGGNGKVRESLKDQVAEFESERIREALYRNAGNISRAAKELDVNRTTFYDMINRYGIDPNSYSVKTRK
jgi:two-component system NtrC family response regulator